MAGWLSEPQGNGLMETPGVGEGPRFARAIHDGTGSKPPPAAWKNPSGAFENIRRRGPADRRKIDSYGAIFPRVSRVKGFGHRAEIVAQPTALRRGDAQRVRGLRRIQRP